MASIVEKNTCTCCAARGNISSPSCKASLTQTLFPGTAQIQLTCYQRTLGITQYIYNTNAATAALHLPSAATVTCNRAYGIPICTDTCTTQCIGYLSVWQNVGWTARDTSNRRLHSKLHRMMHASIRTLGRFCLQLAGSASVLLEALLMAAKFLGHPMLR